jgi:hypothetical protein
MREMVSHLRYIKMKKVRESGKGGIKRQETFGSECPQEMLAHPFGMLEKRQTVRKRKR